MITNKDECAIWGITTDVRFIGNDRYLVNSLRAGGSYEIDGLVTLHCNNYAADQRRQITNWLFEQYILGQSRPLITQSIFKMVENRRALSVVERADRLLRWVESQTEAIGTTIKIPSGELASSAFAWSGSIDKEELLFLLKYLERKSWFSYLSLHSSGFDATISVEGYAHLAELDTKQVNSSQAFVAIWFDASMNDAYENGLKIGIEQAGYKSLRIDQKDHNNRIDDELIAEIRRSKFLVADFTQGDKGARGGVYYEAGFAHGLGIPVIFTCRKDSLEHVHFDTRQYNHIVWETPQDLASALKNRINATLGDGPERG